MADEAGIARALNALSATLNDQHVAPGDAARIQEIATGSFGGEQRLIADGRTLRDDSGRIVARLSYEDGAWSVGRVPEARGSEQLEQAEEQRSKQTETAYQKPVRGRLAIWKKRLTGS